MAKTSKERLASQRQYYQANKERCRATVAAIRKRHIDAGMCSECGLVPPVSGRKCESCTQKSRVRVNRSAAKRRNGGKCCNCSRSAEKGRSRCTICRERDVETARQQSDRRKQDGICTRCGREPATKGAYCKQCKEISRNNNYLRCYGLSVSEVDEILILQSGRCALCGQCLTARFCVDHDHKTGVVRGILCQGCNVMLGGYETAILKIGREKLERYRHG